MANQNDSQLKNQSAPLGIYASNVAKSAKPTRRALWATRAALNATGAHSGDELKRQRACGRDNLGSEVAIVLNPSTETAHAAGLETCGSVWACPVCRAKILSQRAQALQTFADGWANVGGGMFMLTLTVPHSADMSLADVKGKTKDKTGLTGALRRLFSDGSYRRWRERLGYVGAVKSLEATDGRNGWHLHAHILLFTDNSRDTSAQDEDKISEIWARVCEKAGLARPSRQHGARLTHGGAADYVIKWGAPNEVMSQSAKGAKNNNVTIAQMESDVLANGRDSRYVSRLREYYLTMRGAKLITILGGKEFREQLRGLEDKSDEELSAEKEMLEESIVIALIKPRLWRCLYDRRLVSHVLDAAESGGYAAVRGFIKRRVPHWLDEVRMPDLPER